MIGTDTVQPIGRSWPSLGRVQVRIGAPLVPPPPASDPGAARVQAREFTERIVKAIAALSEQQRADLDVLHQKATLGWTPCDQSGRGPPPGR